VDKGTLFRELSELRRAPGRGGDAGARAPHKPLLLLALLSELERRPEHGNRFPFAEAKSAFDALWPRFGWLTATKAAYPFWHLASSPLWVLVGDEGPVDVRGSARLSDVMLSKKVRHGSFSDEAWRLLSEPAVRREAADLLIAHYFPESVHAELRLSLGLPPAGAREAVRGSASPGSRRRSAAEQSRFREVVLLAYEGRCAVCGFRPQNARAPSAIQAAHVWPFEYGGPFDVENGLALCPMHHWALDSGTIGISGERRILVSSLVFDGPVLDSVLRAYSGRELRSPQPPHSPVGSKWADLHRANMFLGQPLPSAG